MATDSLTRRDFIHRCGICVGALALPGSWARLLGAVEGHLYPERNLLPGPGGLAFKYFAPPAAATVEAICEQIIPADEDPGAQWAGVVHYIDLGLAGEFNQYRSAYAAGLSRLEALAREIAPKHFIELDFASQTSVLEKLATHDSHQGEEGNRQEFFRLIRRQTLEGFFGDPKYGGNRDQIGWKILKFEG